MSADHPSPPASCPAVPNAPARAGAGGGPAHAHEQSRSRSGRGSRRLVVYGGSGKAARTWEAFDAIVATLRKLENDETLLIQSGKPVGVLRTHEQAPRVLIANSLLVPKWATWEEFRRLEAMGLTMYGQMTAGSWIYIGSQGILQGTYETFAACAGDATSAAAWPGRLVVTAGLGGMGGAQPLAATMNGAAFLGVESIPRASNADCERATSTA